MKLAIFGPPGGGKGTQAKIISEEFGLLHISTGDILREEVRKKTELGLQAKEYMDRGELVPDDLIMKILLYALKRPKAKGGFILDGFPRTLPQARSLDENISLDRVLNIDVPDDEIVKRITGRLVCPACGSTYHEVHNPPKVTGKCDKCGADLIKRKDDNEETVRRRLNAYHEQTQPVLEYYRKKGIVKDINGVGSIEDISKHILSYLRKDRFV